MMPHYTIDWGVVGHEWAVEHLARGLANDRLRHAYLFTGPSGVGKTTLARGFARAINCLSDVRPCGECRACKLIEANNYADVNIIRAEGKTLKIEQIRELQHALSLRPVEARYRVIILQRFHEASDQAADALLKTLEEPPPYVVIILTAEQLDSVPPTIRSRCQPLALRPLPAIQIRAELDRRGQVDSERSALLAQLSGGRLGWALQAATDESLLADRATALNDLERLISADRVARFKYAEQNSTTEAKAQIPTILALWQSYWRDVMLMISASHISITNRDHQAALEQLSAVLHIEDAQHVLMAIQRTAKYIDANVNARLALEVLMLDLPVHRLLLAPPG